MIQPESPTSDSCPRKSSELTGREALSSSEEPRMHRAQRIQGIKTRIEKGEYIISAASVAEALLERMARRKIPRLG